MKFFGFMRAASVALALLAPAAAYAQTVTSLPTRVESATVTDLGNGPTEFRVLQGNAQLFTSSSSGASGNATTSSTTLALAATPTTVPCVGCIVSGTGITSGTTVSAFSGLTITLSAAMSVATTTTVSWGAACPSTVGTNRVMLVQAGVGADLPLYTQARICGAAQNAPGASLLPFAIGAH